MKLQFSREDEAFRGEVRSFIEANLPADLQKKVRLGLRVERDDLLGWFRLLDAKGWFPPSWPREYGGAGWNHLQRHLFDDELSRACAPRVGSAGVMMLGPVLMAYGTPEQKSKYLTDIRAGNTWWAQGFSEPGAGSDLASLRTTAVLEPDGRHFVVNGHKIWSSYAHWSTMMFALVRTDPNARKPQEGISFVLIDMKSPGFTVRPIRMLEGGTDLNECFLDNVRVPVENLVGELNKGWTYAKYLLGHERTGIAGIGLTRQQLARARKLAAAQGLANDAVLQTRLTQHEVELMALEFTALRILSVNQKSRFAGVEASMLKVRGTELRQAVHATLMEIAGPLAIPFSSEALFLEHLDQAAVAPEYVAIAANDLDARKTSIYGGTNEVQRLLIGRAALGV